MIEPRSPKVAEAIGGYDETIEIAVEEIREELAEGEEVSRYIFEEADAIVAHANVETLVGYLIAAENEPDEWQEFVGRGDSWREAIRAMAFSAIRIDLWDAVEERSDGA